MNRARIILRTEIEKEYISVFQDIGKRITIFMIRMISEVALQIQKNMHLFLIDYVKTFEKTRHKDLLELLGKRDLFGKMLGWSRIFSGNRPPELNRYRKLERWVIQGKVFSPDLYNIYSDTVVNERGPLAGFIINDRDINNIRYGDDTVLLADSERLLQTDPDRWVEEMAITQLHEDNNYGHLQAKRHMLWVTNGRYQHQLVEKLKYLGIV